jgi:hypothetical protein
MWDSVFLHSTKVLKRGNRVNDPCLPATVPLPGGMEGGFLQTDFENATPLQSFLRNLVYRQGAYYDIYVYSEGLLIIRLCVIGIFLFVLLFEGRARYLINHLPYLCLLAGYGFNAAAETVRALHPRLGINRRLYGRN